jgi:glycosyltransferase involved in cell wall biosynthesis
MAPFFSVLVTAYNRERELGRCLASVIGQAFEDFEIIVVDDASTDGTVAFLERLRDPRLRVVRHQHNQGISAARASGVEAAAGEWLVMLDSDWALAPGALARLCELTGTLAPGVRIIRSRIEWGDGRLEPAILPDGVTGYEERLRWLEQTVCAGGGTDAGHCMHREVFEAGNYFRDRRGAVESLWELDLAARGERSLWVADVLTLQYDDAANSHTRELSAARLVPRLRREAVDQAWMAETMLARHGAALARYAPHYRRWLLESAALESLLIGNRRAGLGHARASVRAGASPAKVAATVALGLLGPLPLAEAKVAGRRFRALRRRAERAT